MGLIDSENKKSSSKIHELVRNCDINSIEKCLSNDSSGINDVDESGMTPLLWAVFSGNTKTVELLMKAGADPNKPNKSGDTPLCMLRTILD